MRKNELREMTRLELLETARRLEIKGRSGMSKDDLVDAIAAAGRSSSRAAERKSTEPPGAAVSTPARGEAAPAARAGRRSRSTETSAESDPDRGPRDASASQPPPARSDAEAPARPTSRPSRPDPADEEDEDGHNWNSVALGRDPNYGRFLSPGSIPARPGAPGPRRPVHGAGAPRPHGESLADRSELGRMRAGERSYGAREDLRRSGDARRQSGYTPQYSRPGGRDDREGSRRGLPPRDVRGSRPADGRGPSPGGEREWRRPDDRGGRDRDRNDRNRGDRDRNDRNRTDRPRGERDRDRGRGEERSPHPATREGDAHRQARGASRRPEAIDEQAALAGAIEGDVGAPVNGAPVNGAPMAVPSAGGETARSGAAARGASGLPRHYGIDRCRLMVRDPYCIHAYWEVNAGTVERAREDLGAEWEGHKRILRVHGIPVSGDPEEPPADFFDVGLNEEADNWYIDVPRANRGYRVDIGVLTAAGLFYPLASSNTAITPRDTASRAGQETWAAPPAAPETSPASGEAASSDERAGSDRVAMPSSPAPPVEASGVDVAPDPGDSPESAPPRGRRRKGSPSSPAAPFGDSGRGLLPPGPGIPPGAVPETTLMGPTSPGAMPGEIGVPAAGMPAAPLSADEAGFWFVLSTELVVYGATDPSAQVTLQGQPVRLRPDGTFSLRFQLPDGTQVLEARAVSADGRTTRVITPTVTRQTTSSDGESAG